MAGRHFEEEQKARRRRRKMKRITTEKEEEKSIVEGWAAGKDFLRWGKRKGEIERKVAGKDLKMDRMQGGKEQWRERRLEGILKKGQKAREERRNEDKGAGKDLRMDRGRRRME
jgi:hypothetical protein